ncbi:hypothetical protein M8J76_010192 [Diaphorina citri]|nr:hypothetical protein M8J76_010192 [Diaphorina citri]
MSDSCGRCQQEIQDDYSYCKTCKSKYHFQCNTVSESSWRSMGPERKAQWKCASCRDKEKERKMINTPEQQVRSSDSETTLKSLENFMSSQFANMNKKMDEKFSDFEASLNFYGDKFDEMSKTMKSLEQKVMPSMTTATKPWTSPRDAKHDHCNKTVDIYEDISSPEVTPETYGRPMTCWYRFRAFRGTPRDWILRIRFKKFKVGTLINATHCHNGYMQEDNIIGNKLDDNKTRDVGLKTSMLVTFDIMQKLQKEKEEEETMKTRNELGRTHRTRSTLGGRGDGRRGGGKGRVGEKVDEVMEEEDDEEKEEEEDGEREEKEKAKEKEEEKKEGREKAEEEEEEEEAEKAEEILKAPGEGS